MHTIEYQCFAVHQALFTSLILCNPARAHFTDGETEMSVAFPDSTEANVGPTLSFLLCPQDMRLKDIFKGYGPGVVGKNSNVQRSRLLLLVPVGSLLISGDQDSDCRLATAVTPISPWGSQPLKERLGIWVLLSGAPGWAWGTLEDIPSPAPFPFDTSCLTFSVLGIRALRFPPKKEFCANQVARFK